MKGIRNPFYRKIFYTVIVILLLLVLTFFVIRKISVGNAPYYIIDDSLLEENYKDTILRNYNEYKSFSKKYKISLDLVPEDFNANDYLAVYQEYDPCKEKGVKKFISYEEKNGRMIITFKVNNKCGWCENKIVLYFIAIPKDTKDLPIKYVYKYNKQKICKDVKLNK
ncbi:MAG: hypothetical protein GX951_04795 [Mollicutes bacterium]|nr:hypothetical protein [Mollicutes bacterium]